MAEVLKPTLTPDGLPVSGILTHGQGALTTDYEFLPRKVPIDQVAQFISKFHTEALPEFNVLRLIMNLDRDGQSLIGGYCTIPLKLSKKNVLSGT